MIEVRHGTDEINGIIRSRYMKPSRTRCIYQENVCNVLLLTKIIIDSYRIDGDPFGFVLGECREVFPYGA